MFKFACHGKNSNETWKKIEEFLSKWDAFYESEMGTCNMQEERFSGSGSDEDYHDTQEQSGVQEATMLSSATIRGAKQNS